MSCSIINSRFWKPEVLISQCFKYSVNPKGFPETPLLYSQCNSRVDIFFYILIPDLTSLRLPRHLLLLSSESMFGSTAFSCFNTLSVDLSTTRDYSCSITPSPGIIRPNGVTTLVTSRNGSPCKPISEWM